MSGDNALSALAGEVGRYLHGAGLTVTTAESCTGGWIAKALTDVAGSSAWFEEGFVTYSNAAKHRRLGVSEELLATHGAVSQEVVTQMAEGALRESSARVAVAVSGIAGPDGGSEEKPVGTVFIAWGYDLTPPDRRAGGRPQAAVRSRRYRFSGDREAVRRATVEQALRGLLQAPPRRA